MLNFQMDQKSYRPLSKYVQFGSIWFSR